MKLRSIALGIARNISRIQVVGVVVATVVRSSLICCAADKILLNDSWTDGNRTSTNLPTDSPTWIGQSSTTGGTSSVSTGALNFTLGTSALKAWEYFTSDNGALDGNQPHNAVTHLNVGDTLTASLTFTLTGTNSSSTGKNFRFGLFFDPTNARVQSNTNSDSGGSTNPWADATGYAIQFPINSSSSGNNPLQLKKRTNNINSTDGTTLTSLLGDSGTFTAASGATGTSFALADGTSYTAQLGLKVVSLSQLDVTGTILQGTTVISTATKSDTSTAFGGTPNVGSISVNGQVVSNSIHLDFDQLFMRNSSNVQMAALSFTNWNVTLSSNPPPLLLGDLDRDGALSTADVPALLNALTDLNRYKQTHNLANDGDLKLLADVNQDGSVTNADIQALLNIVPSSGSGSLSAVPEPSACMLLAMGALGLVVARNCRHRQSV